MALGHAGRCSTRVVLPVLIAVSFGSAWVSTRAFIFLLYKQGFRKAVPVDLLSAPTFVS